MFFLRRLVFLASSIGLLQGRFAGGDSGASVKVYAFLPRSLPLNAIEGMRLEPARAQEKIQWQRVQ